MSVPIRSRAADEGSVQIPLWGVALVLVVVYVCLFSGLGAIGLVGPDEPRYAAIARAMAETHDWVTPRLWGTPWFEKPVLYYWAACASMRLFGVSEFAARLPSSLAALLAVLAAAWTALRCYGLGAAWYTLLMLPTSVAMIGFARAAGPDMLFAGFLTAAMAAAVEMLQKPRPGTLARVLFGIFLGAAVLAKGPAAIVLAGGATLLWATFSNQWRAALQFFHPLIVAAFCVAALPWYILCALRNPEFVRIFLWQHNFERYLTPVFEHRQPFWFYGPILLLGILPWFPVLIGVIGQGVRAVHEKVWTDSPGSFFACWAVFPLFFFSLAQSKLPGYILPAIPPLFVQFGQTVVRGTEPSVKNFRWIVGAIGLIFLALPETLSRELPPGKAILAVNALDFIAAGYLIALGAGIYILTLSFRKKTKTGLYVSVLLVAGLVELSSRMVLPRIDPTTSPRSLARELLKLEPSGVDLATYDLPRGWKYGLNFYIGQDLREWVPGMARPKWLVTSIEGENEIHEHHLGSQWRYMHSAGEPIVDLLRSIEPNTVDTPPR